MSTVQSDLNLSKISSCNRVMYAIKQCIVLKDLGKNDRGWWIAGVGMLASPVQHHRRSLSVGVAADVAHVRSGLGVRQVVHSQIQTGDEGFSADRAQVGPFDRVHPGGMDSQVLGFYKFHTADVTLYGIFVVFSHVRIQSFLS